MGNDYEISSVLFYDDITNQVIWNACALGISFSDVDAVREMMTFVKTDGCKRIRVTSSMYGHSHFCTSKKQEFLYNHAGKWIKVQGKHSSLIGLEKEDGRDSFCLVWDNDDDDDDDDEEETLNPSLDNELKFWQARERIRVILADLDPINITRDPVKSFGKSAYAKEAYLMAEQLLCELNETAVKKAVKCVFLETDGYSIPDEDVYKIIKRFLYGDNWHACPVCKEHYFYSHGEKCPVCGWENDPRKEEERDEKYKNHSGSFGILAMKKLLHYLAENEVTKKETQELLDRYEEYQGTWERLFDHQEGMYKDLLVIYIENILQIGRDHYLFKRVLDALERGYEDRVAWLQGIAVRHRDPGSITVEELYENGMIERKWYVHLKKLGVRTLEETYKLGTKAFDGMMIIDQSGVRKLVQLFEDFQLDVKKLRTYLSEHQIY